MDRMDGREIVVFDLAELEEAWGSIALAGLWHDSQVANGVRCDLLLAHFRRVIDQ